jgi:hypothetical protein
MSATPTFTIGGEGQNTSFGRAVGMAGDVNGDGFDDVIVGADGYGNFAGRVYVYAGGSGSLSAAPLYTATGEYANDHFGFSAQAAGDVNGDGLGDFIAGAYRHDDFTGRVYVYAGRQGDGPLSPAQSDARYLVVLVLVATVIVMFIAFAIVRRTGRK